MSREMDIRDLQEVLTSHYREVPQKEPGKACKFRGPAEGVFLDTLKKLGLDKYYPSKLSLTDVIVIRKVPDHPKMIDLPWGIIQSLLMIDHTARDKLLPVVKELEGEVSKTVEGGADFGLSAFLRSKQNTTSGKNDESRINPLDILVAIFSCCDNALKQTLAQKMFVCKLAVPFLYPLGSEGKIMMSIWALRTITIKWDTKQNGSTETPVTEKALPVVTFVRLGRPPISKSILMNDILRDESHDTFFNHNCNNGTVARKFTDGLVECSWFITGKEGKHLPCTTTFLNLRGDASLMSKQMQVLKKISSVVFVIVTAQDLTKETHASTCKDILQNDAKVILLISGNNTEENQACIEAVGIDLIIAKEAHIMPFTDDRGVQLNASDLKTIARRMLSDAISKGCSFKDIEECALLAKKERGVIIDEQDNEFCLEGKILAEKVICSLKGKPIVECKNAVLPLQGAEWIKYCKLMKKQHRLSEKDSQSSLADQANQSQQKMNCLSALQTAEKQRLDQAGQIDQEMKRLRAKQVEICQNGLPGFIKDFMSNLQKEPDVVFYFLKWMALFFDEISRANLPNLRMKYTARWDKYQEAKKGQDKNKIERLKIEMDHAEKELASASFGIEHIFREIGQIYEAVQGCNTTGTKTKKAIAYLPVIAAKLLLKGNPLELVDGDASSVPITWVSAVLSELGKIIGEKKLFVLSVLGIQSSGKSTLLNTMFGLQFPVSAGRCTRGVYIQLIPVDDQADLPFNYIVVLDTEGLRAPELAQLKYDHDNELATLVIGLGDVTMINVKGENTTEVKDILQIVAHAFVRMNIVSKNIRNHRTCIFVHQNVPAADADKLMMQGHQKLLEILDAMAKEAANSENISDIKSFSQIINFDVKKHVWYFSDLWHGNPPMAPANSGYSKTTNAVRLNILWEIAKKQTTLLTTSDLSIRIIDLWKGVLADDFVFSFRNSLEVKAFNALQSEYYTMIWEFKVHMSSWLDEEQGKLKEYETIDDLEKDFKSLQKKLSQALDKKAEGLDHRLRNYFKESNLNDIIVQWKQSKLNQLVLAIEKQRGESNADLLLIKEKCQLEISQSGKWLKVEGRIMNKATGLAEKLRGNESNTDLEGEFEAMWENTMKELVISDDDKELEIDSLIKDFLSEIFHAHRKVLKRELGLQSLTDPLLRELKTDRLLESLENSITLKDVSNNDISLKWSVKYLRDQKEAQLLARKETVELVGVILRGISTYLKLQLSTSDTKFQMSYAQEVIQKIIKPIKIYQQRDDCTFTIPQEFIVKLAIHVSRYCVEVFSRMHSDYNKEHGIKAKVHKKKEFFRTHFKNMVKDSTEDVIAGDTLCAQLRESIEEAVRKEVTRMVSTEIITDFKMTKYSFITKILEDLARQSDYKARKTSFKNYHSYTINAKMFALQWLVHYTDEKIFAKRNGRDTSSYAQMAKLHIEKIIQLVLTSVEYATEQAEKALKKKKEDDNMENKKPDGARKERIGLSLGARKFDWFFHTREETPMEIWVGTFRRNISKLLVVSLRELKHVRERKVVDFKHLKSVILDQLDNVKADVLKVFAKESKLTVKWHGNSPPKVVLDSIWGCEKQCPFCNEPCINTTPNHYNNDHTQTHSCLQHRPQAVGGVRDSKTGEMHTESCNYLVNSETRNFYCSACKYECRTYKKCSAKGEEDKVSHRYYDYQTYLEEWDIAPDCTNSVSKYWMWFCSKYHRELIDMHSAKTILIPESWKSITTQEALTDLRKIHN